MGEVAIYINGSTAQMEEIVKCKVPEQETHLTCSNSSKQAHVARGTMLQEMRTYK